MRSCQTYFSRGVEVLLVLSIVFSSPVLIADPFPDTLAPKSSLDDPRIRARADLEKLLQDYEKLIVAPKKRLSKRERIQVQKARSDLERDILRAARVYFEDDQLFYAPGFYPSRGGRLAWMGRSGILVLTKRLDAKTDVEIPGVQLANRLERCNDTVGAYHVRGYSHKVGISRRQVAAAGIGGVLLAVVGPEIYRQMHAWWSGRRTAERKVDPMDADLVAIHGTHRVSETMKPQLEILKEVYRRHRQQGRQSFQFLFVDEVVQVFSLAWPVLKFRYPHLIDVSEIELLQNSKYKSVMVQVYNALQSGTVQAYNQTFQERRRDVGLLSKPVPLEKKELWDFLLSEGIPTIPEPMTYEAWVDASLFAITMGMAQEALAAKDKGTAAVDEWARLRALGEDHLISGAKRRDAEFAKQVAAALKELKGTRYATIRGWGHRYNDALFEDKGFSYGAISAEDFGNAPLPLYIQWLDKRMKGPVQMTASENTQLRVMTELHQILMYSRFIKARDIQEANRFAHHVLKSMGSPAEIVHWFKNVVWKTDDPDARGEFVLKALDGMRRIKLGEDVLPVGGMVAMQGGGGVQGPPPPQETTTVLEGLGRILQGPLSDPNLYGPGLLAEVKRRLSSNTIPELDPQSILVRDVNVYLRVRIQNRWVIVKILKSYDEPRRRHRDIHVLVEESSPEGKRFILAKLLTKTREEQGVVVQPAMRPLIMTLLGSEDPSDRLQAAMALRNLAKPEASWVFFEVVEDQYELVREQAMRALGELQYEGSVAAFASRLNDPVRHLRILAAANLRTMGMGPVKTLLEMTRENDPGIAGNALSALQSILTYGEWEVDFGRPKNIHALLDLVNLSSLSPEARKKAMGYLARIDTARFREDAQGAATLKRVVDGLCEFLAPRRISGGTMHLSHAAEETLVSLGPSISLFLLSQIRLWNVGRNKIRNDLIKAVLVRWGDKQIIQEALHQTNTHPRLIKAMETYFGGVSDKGPYIDWLYRVFLFARGESGIRPILTAYGRRSMRRLELSSTDALRRVGVAAIQKILGTAAVKKMFTDTQITQAQELAASP